MLAVKLIRVWTTFASSWCRLAKAKPHNGLGWDLVSRVDCIAKLRIIELQREKQGSALFLHARYSIGACPEGCGAARTLRCTDSRPG
jgi:hypothetical protein